MSSLRCHHSACTGYVCKNTLQWLFLIATTYFPRHNVLTSDCHYSRVSLQSNTLDDSQVLCPYIKVDLMQSVLVPRLYSAVLYSTFALSKPHWSLRKSSFHRTVLTQKYNYWQAAGIESQFCWPDNKIVISSVLISRDCCIYLWCWGLLSHSWGCCCGLSRLTSWTLPLLGGMLPSRHALLHSELLTIQVSAITLQSLLVTFLLHNAASSQRSAGHCLQLCLRTYSLQCQATWEFSWSWTSLNAS